MKQQRKADKIVQWSGGRVQSVQPNRGNQSANRRILPGLIDIQINGYAGVDVNSPETQPEDLLRMARRVWASGAALFCPTVLTGPDERIRRAVRTIREAMRQDPLFNSSVLGVHIEGPYISPEDGPRGAHPKQHIRPPNWDEFQRWQDEADGAVRMITLSPEWDGAARFIENAAESGVVPAIGHTNADARQLNNAVQAGAKTSTHLGNAAHSLLPRHPNYIWEQLGNDRLCASFIADGHHLPPRTLKAMIRAKGVNRSILVSDAVWLADMPPGRCESPDGQALEKTADGRVQLADTPYLAGAGLPLMRGVENAVQLAGLSFNEAVQLATKNPARLLNIDAGELKTGAPAHFTIIEFGVEYDAERDSENGGETARMPGRIKIIETVVNGKTAYRNPQYSMKERT